MALPVLNNAEWAPQQKESQHFSKICYIPSLGLSCFGCCGHHFKSKGVMHKFFDKNKKEQEQYHKEGKTDTEFMNREYLVDSCGGCYSLVREKDAQGRDQYLCGVHPLRIGGKDIRPGYCDHDYLCKTAEHVNKMTDEEKALFYQFLKEQEFNSYDYSMMNAQETVLLAKYRAWRAANKIST